jgi:hypothetical protein
MMDPMDRIVAAILPVLERAVGRAAPYENAKKSTAAAVMVFS